MPLHDLFHPPLADDFGWESLHSDWATMIVHRLNLHWLSQNFSAAQRVHFGSSIEVDIGTLKNYAPEEDVGGRNGSGAATAVEVWSPPQATLVTRASFVEEDLVEIQVYYHSGGKKLVAAIELVSPSNKDRPETRNAFGIKCASLLSQGVSVVVVDTVTSLRANLHDELVDRLTVPADFRWRSPTNLSAIAYRVHQGESALQLSAWTFPLTVGQELPTVPLWIAADLAVPLELETTYADACAGLRIE
jgi:hypothetical protein